MGERRGKTGNKKELTLTIGSHVRHGGVLHHSCRASTSHHGRIRASGEGAALSSHGELLGVIHHLLRLTWGRSWLQVRVLLWWGTVEGRAASRIWVAIRGRIHGWTMAEPKAERGWAPRTARETRRRRRRRRDVTTTKESSIRSGPAAIEVGMGYNHQSSTSKD